MGEALPSAPVARRLVGAIAATKLVLHLATANGYGYFRDELYYLSCGRHLDWGYVDHSPLIGVVARVALALGGSLLALRVFPALAGAALVWITGALAARLGGGPYAQALAAVAVALAPIRLGLDGMLSMNAFEPVFWMAAAYVLVRILQGGDRRLWLVFGAILGLGLQNKHSTLFFGFAVFAGLLLAPARRHLATRWPWLGGALAFLIFLPNLVWQNRHGFPTLEALQTAARTGKNVVLGPTEFVGQQVLINGPVQLLLWLAGVVWLFRAREGRYRALGWAFVVFFVVLFALEAKNYYLAPIYPLLFAAGAVALAERWRGRAARTALLAAILVASATLAPLSIPLLPPARFVAYSRAIGIEVPKTEVGHESPLPQHYADRFGWPEMVETVARVYHALPPHDKARARIFAGNYGEAAAIDFFGPRHGLPPAISGHQSYWMWGPRDATGDVVIVLQSSREDLEQRCASVEAAARHHHPWGMADENRPIHVCRGLRTPIAALWPQLKNWR